MWKDVGDVWDPLNGWTFRKKESSRPALSPGPTIYQRWAWLGRTHSSLRPISLSAKWNFSGLFWGWGVGMLMAELCPWHWDSWDNKCHCHYCQRDRPLCLLPLPISLHSLSSAAPMCAWPSSVRWSCGTAQYCVLGLASLGSTLPHRI